MKQENMILFKKKNKKEQCLNVLEHKEDIENLKIKYLQTLRDFKTSQLIKTIQPYSKDYVIDVTFPPKPLVSDGFRIATMTLERETGEDIRKLGLRTMSRKELWVNMEMTGSKQI